MNEAINFEGHGQHPFTYMTNPANEFTIPLARVCSNWKKSLRF